MLKCGFFSTRLNVFKNFAPICAVSPALKREVSLAFSDTLEAFIDLAISLPILGFSFVVIDGGIEGQANKQHSDAAGDQFVDVHEGLDEHDNR